MEKAFNYPPKTNFIISLIACLFLGFSIFKIIKKAPIAKRYKNRKYRNKENEEIKKTTK